MKNKKKQPTQPGGCVYCGYEAHRSSTCDKLKTVEDCRINSALTVHVVNIAPHTRQFVINQIIML
jgi:hypothetical protein